VTVGIYALGLFGGRDGCLARYGSRFLPPLQHGEVDRQWQSRESGQRDRPKEVRTRGKVLKLIFTDITMALERIPKTPEETMRPWPRP
jgi:hypothetical protein